MRWEVLGVVGVGVGCLVVVVVVVMVVVIPVRMTIYLIGRSVIVRRDMPIRQVCRVKRLRLRLEPSMMTTKMMSGR